jgi:hypothetical protein
MAGFASPKAGEKEKVNTLSVAPNIGVAAALCSASIIEFTIPQVTKLSQTTPSPLPAAPLFPHRASLFARMIGTQTALTAVQFAVVRELRDVIDSVAGPSPINLSIAYGAGSVPFNALKYNLVIAGVYRYFERPPPAKPPNESPLQAVARFWRRNIAPGLAWSFLRDCGAVGGGIVLGPVVSAKIATATDSDTVRAPHRFIGGFLAGATCGLATQLFHNTALTAGRMAELGPVPGTVECLLRVFAEHGTRALYVNFQFRVAIIAAWTAILNTTQPFAQEREKKR